MREGMKEGRSSQLGEPLVNMRREEGREAGWRVSRHEKKLMSVDTKESLGREGIRGHKHHLI